MFKDLNALMMLHGYAFAIVILAQLDLIIGDCNSLPKIENTNNNVTGTGPFASGTVIKFECDIGFNPSGTSKIYICSEDQWTHGHLECEEIFCKYISPPENGQIGNSPTFQIGTTVNFKCNTGYDLIGTNTLLCRANGEWHPSDPPSCQIRSCGEFGSIQYASTFQDSSNSVKDGYGSIVKVTCHRGYVLKGKPGVLCQADGTWEDKPRCELNSCPPYPGSNSSCIEMQDYLSSFLLMICRADVPVTKTGPDQVQCINGAWEDTDELMACYCDCHVEADLNLVELINVNGGYLKHKSELVWSCKDGSTKNSTAPLVCNDGNVKKPACQPKATTQKPVTDANGRTTVKPVTDANGSKTVKPVTDANGSTTVKPVTGANGNTTMKSVTDANGSKTSSSTAKAIGEPSANETPIGIIIGYVIATVVFISLVVCIGVCLLCYKTPGKFIHVVIFRSRR